LAAKRDMTRAALLKLEAARRLDVIQQATQPEEDTDVLKRMFEAWSQDFGPQTHLEAFLCRELATSEWRLDRLRRIENGLLWWAVDDIRDRNHEAAKYGQPTGEGEMNENDFFTLTLARAFKFLCAQQDSLTRVARIEAALVARVYKALGALNKLREPVRRSGSRRKEETVKRSPPEPEIDE